MREKQADTMASFLRTSRMALPLRSVQTTRLFSLSAVRGLKESDRRRLPFFFFLSLSFASGGI